MKQLLIFLFTIIFTILCSYYVHKSEINHLNKMIEEAAKEDLELISDMNETLIAEAAKRIDLNSRTLKKSKGEPQE